MAITFVNQSSKTFNSNGTGGVGATLAAPAGVLDGDLLLWFWSEDSSAARWSLQSGWSYPTGTGIDATGGINETVTGASLQCQWKIASGEPATYTIAGTAPTTPTGTMGLLAYRGVDQTTPIHVAAAVIRAAGLTHASATINVTAADAALAAVWAVDHTASCTWSNAAMTERWDLNDPTSLDGSAAYTEILSGVAGSISRTATLSVSQAAASMIIALKPAATAASLPPLRQPWRVWRTY